MSQNPLITFKPGDGTVNTKYYKCSYSIDIKPYLEMVEQAKRDWLHPGGLIGEIADRMYWRVSRDWITELNSGMIWEREMTEEEVLALPKEEYAGYKFLGRKVCMDSLLKGSVCSIALDNWL